MRVPANDAVVTLESQFVYGPVDLTIGGRTYYLAMNQEYGPIVLPAGPATTYTIKVTRADDSTCGTTVTNHFFNNGQSYWVWAGFMVGGGPTCSSDPTGPPGPLLVVNQTPPTPPLTASG